MNPPTEFNTNIEISTKYLMVVVQKGNVIKFIYDNDQIIEVFFPDESTAEKEFARHNYLSDTLIGVTFFNISYRGCKSDPRA